MSYRTRCKGTSCRAEIGMVQLASGRWHPVESLEPEDYQVWTDRPPDLPECIGAVVGPPAAYVRRLSLITSVGGRSEVLIVWRQWRDGVEVAGPCRLVGLESHFATCPDARAFSGQGGPR